MSYLFNIGEVPNLIADLPQIVLGACRQYGTSQGVPQPAVRRHVHPFLVKPVKDPIRAKWVRFSNLCRIIW
jgi:hypothetical protein